VDGRFTLAVPEVTHRSTGGRGAWHPTSPTSLENRAGRGDRHSENDHRVTRRLRHQGRRASATVAASMAFRAAELTQLAESSRSSWSATGTWPTSRGLTRHEDATGFLSRFDEHRKGLPVLLQALRQWRWNTPTRSSSWPAADTNRSLRRLPHPLVGRVSVLGGDLRGRQDADACLYRHLLCDPPGWRDRGDPGRGDRRAGLRLAGRIRLDTGRVREGRLARRRGGLLSRPSGDSWQCDQPPRLPENRGARKSRFPSHFSRRGLLCGAVCIGRVMKGPVSAPRVVHRLARSN